jgi:hypothetical protein
MKLFIKSTIENASFVLADAKKRTEYSFTSCTVLYKISSRYFIASGLFTSTYCREQRVPNGDFLR